MSIATLVMPAALGGVAAGILAADSASLPVLALLGGGGATVAIALIAGWRPLLVIGIAILAFGLGAWRAGASNPDPATSVATLVDGQDHEVLGTVLDDPRPREDRLQLVLGDMAAARNGVAQRLGDRLLVWLPRGVDAGAGDRLLVTSRVELAEDFDGFAYREYLERQGVGAIARARSATVVAHASGPPAILAGLRGALLGGLNDIVPEPEAALGAGILLGVRSAIAPELDDAFAVAGLTHVVAISGWNIAIVAALVTAAVQPLARRRGGRWTTAAVAATSVGGYVLLTGASPSVVRAALMAAAMLVARLGGSRAHAASALAFAALIMLLAAPPVLWDVGFQLSLLATAGLVWFGAPIERRLHRWPGWIREPVALTLAAQLTTLPVILVNFERLSLIAPIANVLVVPFVPVAMLFSATAAVAGLCDSMLHVPGVGVAVTWLAGGCAWLVLRVIVWLGTALGSVPHAAVDVAVPPALAVAWLPMLALASWAIREPDAPPPDAAPPADPPGRVSPIVRRLVRPVPFGSGLVAILLAITVASRPDGLLHVTVLDIGQGDAILIEAPDGTTTLIDGGPDPELTLRRMGANLPFFARGVDLLVVSHPHQDHVAGLVEVLERHRVGTLLHAGIPFENPANDRLMADARRGAIPTVLARAGQRIDMGTGASATVLYPAQADVDAPLPDGDINNGSIVLRLAMGGFTALLTGDAEAPVEAALVSRGAVGPVDVLKVGHHGSNSSTTPAFVDAVRPSIAIVSSGEDNEYGHPAPETLATLATHAAIAVFRTDLHGDVEVVTDGTTLRVRTDDGWTGPLPVHGAVSVGSIGRWPSPTATPPDDCLETPGCRRGSWSTPGESLVSPWRPPGWSPRRRSRSTAPWSRRPRCSTTSTRSRFAGPAASTGWSERCGSRRSGTRSSRCRSPPIRCTRSWTTIVIRSAGPRSSWPSPTATSGRSS